MEKQSLSNYGVNSSIASLTRVMINVSLRTESRRFQFLLVQELLEREAAVVRQSQQPQQCLSWCAIISAALSCELPEQPGLLQARFNFNFYIFWDIHRRLSFCQWFYSTTLTTTRNRRSDEWNGIFRLRLSRSLSSHTRDRNKKLNNNAAASSVFAPAWFSLRKRWKLLNEWNHCVICFDFENAAVKESGFREIKLFVPRWQKKVKQT